MYIYTGILQTARCCINNIRYEFPFNLLLLGIESNASAGLLINKYWVWEKLFHLLLPIAYWIWGLLINNCCAWEKLFDLQLLGIESMCQVYSSRCGSWHNNTEPVLSHWLIIYLAVKISLHFCNLQLVCIVLFIYYHTIKFPMLFKAFFISLKVWYFKCCHSFTTRPLETPHGQSGMSSQLNLNSQL